MRALAPLIVLVVPAWIVAVAPRPGHSGSAPTAQSGSPQSKPTSSDAFRCTVRDTTRTMLRLPSGETLRSWPSAAAALGDGFVLATEADTTSRVPPELQHRSPLGLALFSVTSSGVVRQLMAKRGSTEALLVDIGPDSAVLLALEPRAAVAGAPAMALNEYPIGANGPGPVRTITSVDPWYFHSSQIVVVSHEQVVRMGLPGRPASAGANATQRPLSLVRRGGGWRVEAVTDPTVAPFLSQLVPLSDTATLARWSLLVLAPGQAETTFVAVLDGRFDKSMRRRIIHKSSSGIGAMAAIGPARSPTWALVAQVVDTTVALRAVSLADGAIQPVPVSRPETLAPLVLEGSAAVLVKAQGSFWIVTDPAHPPLRVAGSESPFSAHAVAYNAATRVLGVFEFGRSGDSVQTSLLMASIDCR
jgi:hypothetical protein